MNRAIYALAAFLATPRGFLWTMVSCITWFIPTPWTGFSDVWMLAYTLFLSIAAIFIGGIILVAGARDAEALHAKLDTIIRYLPELPNDLVRAEELTREEIERRRP